MKNKTVKKVKRPKPNWLGFIKWQKLYSKVGIACCDCGLGHTFEFRVGKKGQVEWRAKRNKELTKMMRAVDQIKAPRGKRTK